MSRFLRSLAVVSVVLAVAGCHVISGVPALTRAVITPEELKPGDTAVITVKAADRHKIIDRVEGVVQEDPRVLFKLRDDGVVPDEKAGDKTWTLQVDVPFKAPPGDFVLEFTAYRRDGLPVPVRDKDGNVTALSTTLPITIRYAY